MTKERLDRISRAIEELHNSDIPHRTEKLIDSINNTARSARSNLNLMMAIAVYLCALILSADDDALLRNKGKAIPQLGVSLPIVSSFIIIPPLFLFVQITLVNQLHTLQRKIDIYKTGSREFDSILSSFSYLQLLWQPLRDRWLATAITVFAIYIVPATLLSAIMIRFLPYQSMWITVMHNLAVFIGIMLPVQLTAISHRYRTIVILTTAWAAIFFLDYINDTRRQYAPIFGIASLTTQLELSKNILLKQAASSDIIATTYLQDKTLTCTDYQDHNSLPCIYEQAAYHFATGLDLEGRQLAHANFEEATLYRVDFQYANLQGANFIRASLQHADFAEANLKRSNLTFANLEKAALNAANLQEATLEDARLKDASLKKANLFKANLEGANLKGANLEDVNLERAYLEGASLQKAILIRANLKDAHLGFANLNGVNLWNATLYKANLEDTTLENANLWNTNLSRAKLWGVNLY